MKEPSYKTILSWGLYDWANSSFFTIVITYIFPAYFVKAVAPDHITGTYWWGNAIAFSALLVALGAPVFGAIADYGGKRKLWISICTYLGIIATGLLWFAYPNVDYAWHTLTAVILSVIAFEIGIAFYNSLLPSIAPPSHIGRVSGWSWGLGYIGGLLSLIICLFAFVQGNFFGLSTDSSANIRICGPFTALWVYIFSRPLFMFVHDTPHQKHPTKEAIKLGITTLWKTLKKLPKNRSLLFFFASRIFYIDGLNTLFAFGGIYAAGTFNMNMSEVILLGIVLNITAGFGAMLFAWIDDWFGAKLTITVSLLCLSIAGTFILLIKSKLAFWILASILGTFVGPVQAASRSLLVRMVPEKKITEMFGLFAFSGKATNFMGPWLVALLTKIFDSQRVGMTVIILFFIIGLFGIQKVSENHKVEV
ncbi:MAG: MFS transporter [Chlamydiota bacterium]